MNSLYLLVNICSVIVPFIFSFHPKLKFHKEWKYFFPALFIASGSFIIWDAIFTNWEVWGFNEKYILGIYLGELPLEEVLFFICIPYCCVFTYHCLNLFFDFNWNPQTTKLVTLFFSFVLLGLGLVYFGQAYTSVTFISLSILLLIYQFVLKGKSLSKMYSSWLVLLIPFLIVNGILTGTGLEEPVVWYDNTENFSIRIYTIPIEDIFYGFLLFLLTVTFMEIFRYKSPK
jgi:lycopene cyclase domain-containing protein